jgi:hypothetical protein
LCGLVKLLVDIPNLAWTTLTGPSALVNVGLA